ncbi:hypothetical protein GCM10009718_14410 [Isoptericola halotolerans]|uniref:Alpha/beta hydrolase family protein n=1 Tax=Isoptericola halotolerans TaxID=300560 RepID=A0ABX2A207_9MICO|nr:hypothetical protein [Isoptericola halotolerans]NOV95638.1 hypothetical protein [Isoptericola halotolerans]
MTRLVLLHGRDTAGQDAASLKSAWLAALDQGFRAAGSPVRVTGDDATLVFYADTLGALVGGVDGVVDEPGPPPVERYRLTDVPDGALGLALRLAREVLAGAGVPPDATAATAPSTEERTDVVPSDLTDALVRALAAALAAVDRFVPGLSGAVVLLLARDVHAYLHVPAVRAAIDEGVAAALPTDEPAVVVAHSLGAVVAYEVLRSADERWQVPLLCTVGSPLALRAVREMLAVPLTWPAAAGWVDVRDPRDLLALHDLTPTTFPLPGERQVRAVHVENPAPWRHAAAVQGVDGTWTGYLATPGLGAVVADAWGGPALTCDEGPPVPP